MAKFVYIVDLDERGTFAAHVENHKGEDVFTILAEDEPFDLVEYGYMKHVEDVRGLAAYLEGVGIIGKDDTLTA